MRPTKSGIRSNRVSNHRVALSQSNASSQLGRIFGARLINLMRALTVAAAFRNMLALGVPITINEVVVYHSGRLHEGIANSAAKKSKTELLKVFADLV